MYRPAPTDNKRATTPLERHTTQPAGTDTCSTWSSDTTFAQQDAMEIHAEMVDHGDVVGQPHVCICAAAELAKASAEAEEEVEAERTVPSPRGGHTSDASGGVLTSCNTCLPSHLKVSSVKRSMNRPDCSSAGTRGVKNFARFMSFINHESP